MPKPADQLTTPARVTISRLSSNREPYDRFELRLTDIRSGLLVATCELTPEQFALAITGANVEAPITLWRSEHHGRQVEVRTLPLPLTAEDWGDPELPVQQVAEREFYRLHRDLHDAGWRLDRLDARFNIHRVTEDRKGYFVSARRYVEIEQEQAQ